MRTLFNLMSAPCLVLAAMAGYVMWAAGPNADPEAIKALALGAFGMCMCAMVGPVLTLIGDDEKPCLPGYDPSIDRERSRSRSRNRF